MQEPDIVRRDPQAYYSWLRTQRVPGAQAYQMVVQRFGQPQTQGEIAKDRQQAAETAGLAQAGGAVLGAVGTGYLYNQLSTPSTPTTPTAPTPSPTFTAQPGGAAAAATPGTQATWNAGADAAGATPQVISSQGNMSTVQTPVGAQQVPTESLSDPGFWGSVNWGQVAQGGLGLAQMYGAYQAYKSGDKVGAGLQGATGAGNVALATGAASSTGTLGTTVIPGLNLATGAYGAYQTAEQTGSMAAGQQRDIAATIGGASSGLALGLGAGALAGASMGSWAGPIGMAIGAAAGYVGSKYFGSSKKKPQMMRDTIRGVLQERGVLDDNFQGTLADGSTYDFGKDGSTLKWKNIDKIAEAQPNAWNAAVPAADALAASYGFVGQKASDIAAWYAKGAVSNAGNDGNVALSNMQHFAKQQGITMDLVKTKLDEALKDNRITQDKYNYYMSGANQLLGGAAASGATVPAVARPEKGQVARQSGGLYRDDKGKLVQASSRRQALERAYKKTEGKGKD